jgi:transposase
MCRFYAVMSDIIPLTKSHIPRIVGINIFTYHMAHSPTSKRRALQAAGTFNPRGQRVRHALFQDSDFFDPEDLVQLKYETLRAVEQDGYSLARAAGEFGLSRPTIYQAQTQFHLGGLEGLLPRKRGPKQPHKLTAEVRQYLEDQRRTAPSLDGLELARRVRQRFGVKLHRRTIEKAFQAKAKRGRLSPP